MTQLAINTLHGRFGRLLADHGNIVFKVTNTYCRHAEDRRDLAQEIRLQLWRAFPSYDADRKFSTWMYRIALNVAISHVRRAGARLQQAGAQAGDMAEGEAMIDIDGAAEHEATVEPDERVAALRRFIGALDTLNRALLLLYLEEHSYAEIAEILGISATNVATKLNRLKQRARLHVAPSRE